MLFMILTRLYLSAYKNLPFKQLLAAKGPALMHRSLIRYAAGCQVINIDDFVKRPTSALRFIALSLRRTMSTPRDTRFARLEFGTFYKVVCKSTFHESIIRDEEKNRPLSGINR